MTSSQICPPLSLHKLHAKKLQKKLGLKRSIAGNIVANISDCLDWQHLINRCGTPFDYPSTIFPIYFLEPPVIDRFWELVVKYEIELKRTYNPSIHLPDNLLTLVVNKKVNAVGHDQIDNVLCEFDETAETPESFVSRICAADNTAYKVLKSARKLCHLDGLSEDVQNLWLHNPTYQQNFYAYYYFDNTKVLIKVREWDTGIKIPNLETSIVNKNWFVDYMVGYVNMLAKEFVSLGYQPTFEFFKIQNVFLPNLTSEFKNNNHPNHGVHRLVEKLMALNGHRAGVVPYSEITEKTGIKVSFTKELYR